MKINSTRIALLLVLAFAISVLPSGAGIIGGGMTTKQMKDSIDYYRYNTMINYDLIKQRVVIKN